MPLDDQGNLLSIGGKNSSVDGWSPRNVSTYRGGDLEQQYAVANAPVANRTVDGWKPDSDA